MSSLLLPDFGSLFTSAADAYLALATDAPHFTIVAVTDAYLHATMTEREQIVGRGLFEVFPDPPQHPHATGVTNLRNSLDRVLRERAPHAMPLQKYDIRRPDGSFEERFWKPLNSPVLDDQGGVIYILHRVEDVTRLVYLERQRDEAEAKSEAADSRVARILDTITDAFCAVDSEWRFTFLNAAAQRTLLPHPDGLVLLGRVLWDVLPGVLGTRFEREFRLAIQEHRPAHFEELFTPLGVWFEVHAYPSAEGLSVYFRDVTEKKAAEVRLRALESITDAFFAVDRGWRFTYVNPVAEREIFHQAREALIGKTLWDALPDAWNSRSGRLYRRAMDDRRKVQFETRIGGKHFEIHAHPSNDVLAVCLNDVTERHRSETALRENEARYRAVFDNSMDAALLTAPNGRIVMANRAATELFGYTEEELRALGRQAIVDQDDPRLARGLEQRRRTGRFLGELTMKRKDGTRIPVELSSATFRSSIDDDTSAEWTSMFIRDASERKVRDAERERLVAEVEARRRWLEGVLENVPLGVVLYHPDGQVAVNRRGEELFGMRILPEEGSAQYAARILFPDGTPVPRDQLVSSRVFEPAKR